MTIGHKGFTFIELMVVLILLGLMVSFALPRMDGYLFSDGADRVSRWIVLNVANLKTKAVTDQALYAINVDVDNNAFWISSEAMDEAGLEQARSQAFKLSGDVKIMDVIHPYEPNSDEEALSDVLFYKKGYSDRAIIHIETGDSKQISFIIEPFLPQVEIRDGYVGYE